MSEREECDAIGAQARHQVPATAAQPTALTAYLAAYHAPNDDSRVIERAAAKDEMRMKLNFQGLTLDLTLAKSKRF
jgi:hypothetical protein